MAVCSTQSRVRLIPPVASLQDWPRVPALDSGEIHVWTATPLLAQEDLAHMRSLLSSDEEARRQRFRFEEDCNRFLVSRGLLRILLGAYFDANPSSLEFTYSEKGKPHVSHRPGQLDLRFNVAHSGDVILLAFTEGRRLGIDVEQVRPDFATDDIAERFFSTAERKCLGNLPATHRHRAFFHCWTRKEAYLKATGDGLSMPLDQFDVSLAPGEPARLIETRPDPAEADRWELRDLPVPSGYAGALVVERTTT